MSVKIAGIEFDHSHYDVRGDVLYLSVGPPQEAARTLETPEGHAVDYEENGSIVGMVLLNVRWSLENEGALTLTQPAERLEADQLQAVLSAA
jgi:uncharacterized protein YuzE